MKARMKNNLITKYQMCKEFDYRNDRHSDYPNELLAAKATHGMQDYFATKQFLNSIEGKVVDLVFTSGCAFEANENDHWLPGCLWEPL